MSSLTSDDLLAQVLQRNDRLQGRADTKPKAQPAEEQLPIFDCLTEGALNVFSKMVGTELVVCGKPTSGCSANRHPLTGVITISGTTKVMIALNLSESLAFHVAEALTGVLPTTVDNDLIDLVGELANMVGGNTKERLQSPGLSLSLPTVITGHDHRVAFVTGMDVTVIKFACEHGDLMIEVGVCK